MWDGKWGRELAAMGNLTVLGAKKLKEPGRYSDGKGLILHIRESGAKTWVLRIQVDGKRRDFGLGAFDDVSLAEARDKADELRKQAKAGIDPVAAKKAAKAVAELAMTFEKAAEVGLQAGVESQRARGVTGLLGRGPHQDSC